MKLIIEIDEDDYTMCQILAKEMCDTRLKLTDNLKYAISNGIPLDKIRAEIDVARFIDKDTKLCKNANASGLEVAMQIIDRFREGSE